MNKEPMTVCSICFGHAPLVKQKMCQHCYYMQKKEQIKAFTKRMEQLGSIKVTPQVWESLLELLKD